VTPDPRSTDARRFRRVLVLTLLAYAAAGVGFYVAHAPPAMEWQNPKYRVAQLLLRSDEDARKKAEEEAKRKAEEAARQRAEEEAKRRAEEEARRLAEAEARKKAAEEARKRAEEEARQRAEEEAKRKAEEEARRLTEEEARKKAQAEARQRAQEEAQRQAEEEARRQAEEAQRLAEEARVRAAEEVKRRAEEQARQQAEAEARQQAEEEARKKAEEEARRQAEEALRLARIRAALEEKRRREEEQRRNTEAALSSGLMAGMESMDESVREILPEAQKPLVASPEVTPPGGSAPAPKPEAGQVDGTKAPAPGGGISQANLADIDQLLGNLEDMEGIDKILGDQAAAEPASKEEILAFLQDVAAGRVSGPMVAHATTVVESPFRILGEVGGVSVRKADEITAIILSHRVELADLYSKALVRNPGFSGIVTVQMVIGPDGAVRDARVVASTTKVPGFDQAVVGRVVTWRFPVVAAGEVTGVYPFRFSEAR
jgi:TonB family protein